MTTREVEDFLRWFLQEFGVLLPCDVDDIQSFIDQWRSEQCLDFEKHMEESRNKEIP